MLEVQQGLCAREYTANPVFFTWDTGGSLWKSVPDYITEKNASESSLHGKARFVVAVCISKRKVSVSL